MSKLTVKTSLFFSITFTFSVMIFLMAIAVLISGCLTSVEGHKILDKAGGTSKESGQVIKEEKLKNGVKRWSRVKRDDKSPWFFQQVENIWNVIWPSPNELPFGESVAFLVGVSKYKHLSPQLEFVENDIKALRAFLINEGGFDTVYVADDEKVTPGLVKNYMANKFRNELGKQDRLLFYYSGHGAHLGGKTGYMQFSQAKSDDFANHVLPINECEEWSRMIPAKHILFIYDCCVSGLAFTTEKSGESNAYNQSLPTLSGNGSRTVIYFTPPEIALFQRSGNGA